MTNEAQARNPRVAIVDDDLIWQKLLVFVLQKSGLEVRTFSSARTAWEFVQKNPSYFHCFLLDFHLQPGEWNGGQLARELRACDDVPIALLSSENEIEQEVQQIPSAIAISKRLPFETLCEKIKTFLSHSAVQPS